MKSIVDIDFTWLGWDIPPKIKSPAELEQDKKLIRQVLQKIGEGHLYQEDKPFYEFDLEKDDERLQILVTELKDRPDLVSPSIPVDKLYSAEDLQAAELYRFLVTNDAIEEDHFDMHREFDVVGPSFERCPVCNSPLRQRRDLYLRKALMKKHDISKTYDDGEIIVSERIARLFQEHKVEGASFREVQNYPKPRPGAPSLFQLVITHSLPPMASPPTEFEQSRYCGTCGQKSQFIKHTFFWGKIKYLEETDIYYPASVLTDAKDINYSAEFFGELPVMKPYIIISKRMYRLLLEHKVKDLAVEPVRLVGEL